MSLIGSDVPFQSVDEKRDVLKPLEETSQEISSEEVQPFESDAIDKEVAEEATTPSHQKGKLDEVDVLQKPEKKPKKKKQVAPKELEDRPDVKMNGEKLEKVKLLPVKLERREIKPQKVVVTEPEKPQFASIKLKKAPISKKDQPKRVSFSVPRLKSRIRFVDFPPENQREQKPIVTYLGSVLDQGILSRNAREALKVLKLKPIKVKLPEDLERPVLEKVQFDKEDIQEVQKAKLDDTWTSEPKETKPEEQPQPQKLKLGKGKIPVEENLQEKVSLKKIPSKPSDEEPSENIPQKQVEQKPLTKPDIPSDEEVTLGKIEGFPPSSSDYEEDILKPEESQVSLDEHTDDQPKARKPKKKVVKTPEFEESILKKGIPKPTLPEETDDITLKKKQGELPVEEPEEIHLKPWVKEKPGIEKEPEGLNVGTPKPFDVEHPEADITPQEFETNDKEKPKKKRVVKKKSLQTPLNEELTQPDFETTEDLPETYPQEEAPTLVETPLVTNKPYVESEIVTQTMPQKSVKLDEPKEDKTAETNEDIVQEELTKKIEDEAETVTDVEPNQENIVKDQPTAEKKKKRKKSVPVESPEEPKPQEKSEDIPKISEIPEDKPEESKLEPEQKPEIEETPTEEASPKKKIVKKKKKVPKPDDQPEIVLDVDLDEEIERPVLEKYEPTPFVPKKKQIDQEKKEKLKGFEKQTIVRTEGAPKKVQVVPVDEVPQLATIKLKKATPVKRDDRRSVSLPKFLLKSRITRVPFPPDALIPVITNIGAKRDAGELSRNAEEAIKVLKKKRKKVKLPEDEERPELEEYTPFEDEERPEKPAEDTEPKPRVEKPKQPEIEVPEPIKIEPKKGVVPETVEQPEEVKLRKVPEKVVETDTPTEKKPKKKSKDEVTPKPAREDETVDLKPFEPYDIPQEDIELEQPERMPYEKPEKEKSPETKPKRTKPEKKKPEPEVIESVLVPGVPKPKPDDEPEDIKLRIKQGPIPDEVPDEIKLKPFAKEKPAPESVATDSGIKPKPIDRVEDDEDFGLKPVKDKDTKKKRKKSVPVESQEEPQPEVDLKETPQVSEIPEDKQDQPTEIKKKRKKSVPVESLEEPKPQEESEDIPKISEIPEDKPEESKLEPEQKPEIEETPTEEASPKKKIVKKKKKVPKPDDQPEIVLDIDLDEEIERPVLEKYEPTPFVPKKKQIEQDKKEKLKGFEKQTIVRTEGAPKKVQVVPVDEVPQLAAIKLKKATPVKRDDRRSVSLPKFLLKSRITRVPFPPDALIPVITNIGAKRDAGELSRNAEEAIKVLKKKRKKVKLPEDEERPELEEYTPFEDEERPEKPAEDTEPKPRVEKPKQPESEVPEPIKIEPKKGVVPETVEQPEEVKLRKVPEKVVETDTPTEKKPKKKSKDEVTPKPAREDETVDLKPFEPYDIPQEDIELEQPEKMPYEKPEKEKSPETKPKRTKPEKKKPEPEVIESVLVPGVPKPKPDDEPEDIKLRIKQGPIPDEVPDEIKLKPFAKEKPAPESVETDSGIKPKPIDRVEDDEDFGLKPVKDKDTKKKRKKSVPVESQEEPQPEVDLKETPQVSEIPEDKQDQPTEIKKKRKKSVPVESLEEPKPQEESEDIPKISEIPEDKPEESKLEPEQKPEIEETPTEEASPKKKIVKKKKKVPKPDDQPEIVLDIDLDEEIERPVLEKYEPTPFVPKKKQIEQDKKEKLKGFEKQTIVRTEGAPKKVQVVPVDEVPQLATIKLKKATPVKRDDRRSVSLPKFLLKSRITRVPFPPDALIPVITNIGAKRDAGELSRNAEEAIKVLKKKRKKVKLPEDEERPELEEYTPFEDEERPEKPAEDTEPKPRVEKPKQPESEVLEPIKIEPKKGVVPETVEQPEEVKLRKVPEKVVETDTPTEKKPKKKSKDEVTPKPAREDETVDLKPFEPYDIPQEDIKLEQPEKMPYEKPEKEKSPETKPKRTKPEKKKPEPEVIESVLVPGVPKPKPDDEPEDIKLRIKQGPVPDETPSEITLKPLSKPAVEAEDKPEEYLTLPKPAKPVTPEPEDNESVQIIVKKKKPKPSVVDEVAEAVTIKKAPIEESKDIKEEPEESLTLEKIPKPQMDEAPDVLSIVKMQPEVLEQEEDLTPAVTVERKKSKPSVVDEAVTLKKLEPEKPSDAEQVEEKIVVKKKKPKQPVVDEIPEALTIQKAEPEKSTDDVEVEQKVIVTKKEPKRPDVDESSEAVSIKKVEPVQPKGEDVVEEKVVLKQKKPTQPDADEISESVTVKKVEPEKPKDDEVIEKVVVKKKKAKQPVPEEISEAVTIKKVEPEKPKEEEAPSVSLKVPKQPEQPTVEDAEEKVTIKKIIPEEPIPADETSQELILKKKPKVPTDEAVSEEVTIKKIVPELPAEDTQVTEEVTIKKKPKQVPKAEEVSEEITVKKPLIEEPEEVETVTFKPKTTKKKEEVEQEFKIQLQQYEEEEISMSGKVRLKKPKPMTFSEEAGAGTIQITQEIDDESGPIIEEVSDDEGLQPEKIREDFEVKLRRRPSEKRYSIQDIEEEIQVGFRKEKRESVVYEEESLAFKPKPKRRPSQPTEQTEDVSLSITKETEVLKEESEDVVLADGDLVYSICSYVAENEDAMNLVEGERVYILESHNSDWWFVRKTLTAEKGWVPAKILKDEVSYTHHLTHTLHEKIDKLPVFEKPAPGETASAPRFVEKLQPQHAPDGATVQLECRVEGNPKPQITWFRETAIIKPSADFQMYYDEDNVATLIIREVFPEDAGFFTCVAKNNVGFASSTAELHVEAPLSDHGSDITAPSRKSMSRESSLADILEGIPPTFSRKPKAKCVPVGEDVDLECRLVAIPEPEVTWFFNGKEITTEKNVTVSMDSDMHSYSSVVRISKITRTQEGTYTVVAKNREGEASMTITVKVQTGEKEAPQILEPLRSVTIREGDSAVLSTQIVGNPKPKVSWHKDGKAAPKLPTKADGDTYTLTLIQPKVSDSAQYTVKAANEVGKCETSATLTVEALTDKKPPLPRKKSINGGQSKEMPRPEPPLFVERFQELKVKEKSTIKLVAKVTGNPTPQITWFKDNEPLQPSPRVKETFDGSVVTLQVSGADSELDSGDYKCLASNPSGKASHGARVTVDVDKVTFTRKLQKSITVDEHDSIKLECETSHTVSTKWYHNGKELSGMDHREIVQENRVHRLVIKRTKALDAGTYACKVKDQSTECSVSVRETKAEFVRKVEDIEVTEREVAVLEVEVSSDTAEVTWHKDGEQLKEAKDKVVFEKKGGVRRLLIRSTSVHDEGEYTCSLGEQECTAEVTVIELPPEIITKLKDTTVAKGDRATFEIELTKGDALVKWFKDGKELQFSEHVQLAIDGKRQKLKIYNAELSDAGVFSCQVRDQTSSATLTVTAVPIIEVPKNEYKVKKGNDVTLEVKFVSTPPPTDEWSVNGTVIKKSKKAIPTLSESSASLTIKKVEETDVGNYNIKLKNPSGEASAELTLILIEPPGAPGTPDVLEVTNDTITLHWKAPESDGNSPITEYILEYHARGEFTWSNACKDTRITETTHKITKLTTNAELTFRVLAVNEAGPGEPSPATRFIRIAKSGAAEAPVIMEPLKDSTVGLGQSATLQCVISGTPAPEIKWLKNGTVIKEKTMKYEDHVAKYTINQSTENSVGKYTCQAKNEAGSAETSCNLSVQDIPTVEIDETLLNQRLPVKEQWKVKASFTGYPKPEVSWSKNGKQITSDKTTVIHTDEMSSTIAIYSVLREDSAKYTIMVTNSAGSANKDVELKVVDKPGKPQGPMELKDIDSESVTITWKPPVDDGGLELSKYSIEKCETKRMVWTKVADVDKDVQLYCVQKLQEDSEYMFRVFAQNPVGLSEPLESPPVTPRSAFDKPSAPRGPFEISSMTETSFTLKWQPPESDGGSPILEYLLERREAGKKAWQKVGTTSGEVTFINVPGLKANTPYNFRVTASNLVGSGPPYAPEEPITAGKMISQPAKTRVQVDEAPSGEEEIPTITLPSPKPRRMPLSFPPTPAPRPSLVVPGLSRDTGVPASLLTPALSSLPTRSPSPSFPQRFSPSVSPRPSSPALNLESLEEITSQVPQPRSLSIDFSARKASSGTLITAEQEVLALSMSLPVTTELSPSYLVIENRKDSFASEYEVNRKKAPLGKTIDPSILKHVTEEDVRTILTFFPVSGTGSPKGDEPQPERQEKDSAEVTVPKCSKVWPPGSSESVTVQKYPKPKDNKPRVKLPPRPMVYLPLPVRPITIEEKKASPSAPTNLTVIDITSRSVTLQWGPPENLGGTDLTGYIVERQDAGSQKWVKMATLEPSCTQYCCENLKEKSEFTFRVLAENSVGLSPPASTDRIQLKTHATPPSPPTAPLEILAVGPYAVVIEWGTPESDGGSPLTGYTIAIRDTRKTMWMEVGRVKADVQKLNIKDLQENHEYLIRIFAVNEVGSSEPLESEEPFKVLKPSDLEAADYERAEATDKDTPSVSFSTETTTSWMRENNMDADIETYAKGSLLQKDEYFFKIWCYAKKLFK